jgi:hypothetical protein
VALLALGLGSMSQAQGLTNPLLPVQGTKEVFLRGNLQFEPDDFFFIEAGYGPFLSSNLQVGGSLSFTDPGEGDNLTTLGLFANYHFPGASQVLPYVGAFIGFSDAGDGSSTAYGLQGGVKYFINSSVAATAQLVYRDFDESGADAEVGISFGLATYLR